MVVTSEILRATSEHVYALFHQQHSGPALYHNYDHTVEVVEHVTEIGEGMKLGNTDMETVLLAAWFHDTGYLESREEHEERSAVIAAEFLRAKKYPAEKIKLVTGCIRATKVPQQPETVIEQVMCDADLLHLGKEDCLEKGELLRQEIEKADGEQIPEDEWLQQSIVFFENHSFHTPYALTVYNDRRQRNLSALHQRLRELEHKTNGRGM